MTCTGNNEEYREAEQLRGLNIAQRMISQAEQNTSSNKLTQEF
jgi:hypothetical protein